jgi:predicted  nucleic acid-binding Zn-ribbon protein
MVIGIVANAMGGGTGENELNTLAIFPFDITPVNKNAAESIALSLTRLIKKEKAFKDVVSITPQTLQAINFEEKFQRSGFTDTDTVLEAGRKQNASHVLAGNIIGLSPNLYFVTASILDVKSLQQIAGYYTFTDSLMGVDAVIPAIAKTLSNGAKRKVVEFPGLAITPFQGSEKNMDKRLERMATHIFACQLTNGKQFAVLPRTENVEQVQEEHKRQGSGTTDQSGKIELGRAQNAQCVLSIGVQMIESLVKMRADVLDINNGTEMYGYEKNDPLSSVDNIRKTAEDLAKMLESGADKAKNEWDAVNKYQASLKKAADDKKAKEDAARMELTSAKDLAKSNQTKLDAANSQIAMLQNEKAALQNELDLEKKNYETLSAKSTYDQKEAEGKIYRLTQERDKAGADLAGANQRATELTAQLNTAKQQVNDLTGQLAGANQRTTELISQLNTAKQQAQTAGSELKAAQDRATKAETDLQKSRADLTGANQRITDLTGELNTAKQQLAEQTRNAQSVSQLDANLKAKDADLQKSRADLAGANQRITDLTGELNTAKQQAQSLSTQNTNAQKAISENNGRIKALEEELQKSRADLAKEKALTTSLEAQLKAAQSMLTTSQQRAEKAEAELNRK